MAHVYTPAGRDAELIPLVGGYLLVGHGRPELVLEHETAAYPRAEERRQGEQRIARDRRKKRGVGRRTKRSRRRRDLVTLREDLEVAVMFWRLRQQRARRTPPGGVRP